MSKVGPSCCTSHEEGGCIECTLEWGDKGLDDEDAVVVAHVIKNSPILMILHLG